MIRPLCCFPFQATGSQCPSPERGNKSLQGGEHETCPLTSHPHDRLIIHFVLWPCRRCRFAGPLDEQVQGDLEAAWLCRAEDGADAGPFTYRVCSPKTFVACARDRGGVHADGTGRDVGQQGRRQHPDEHVRHECGVCECALGGPWPYAGRASGRLQWYNWASQVPCQAHAEHNATRVSRPCEEMYDLL